MIIDAFIANDEIDLAKFRISFLQPVVQKFYVGESSQTHQGRKKPLHFTANQAEFENFGADIEVLEIPGGGENQSFRTARDREDYQRDWFLKKLKELHPQDVIHFSDIDEVASHEQLLWAKQNLGPNDIASIRMQFAFRYVNWLLEPVRQNYRPSAVFRGTAADRFVRNAGYPVAKGEMGGHLSYVGFSSEQIGQKFSSFSHDDLALEHLSTSNVLEFADEWGIDHIGRPSQPGFGLLKGIRESEMSSVLRAAKVSFPHWHRDFPKRPLLRRLVASAALGSFRSTGDPGFLVDPSRSLFDPLFLRHLGMILVHTVIRLTGTGTLIKRLRSRKRK